MFEMISLPKSSETWPLVLLTITQSEYKKLSEEIFVPRHTQSPVSVKILKVLSLKGNTEEAGLTLNGECWNKGVSELTFGDLGGEQEEGDTFSPLLFHRPEFEQMTLVVSVTVLGRHF